MAKSRELINLQESLKKTSESFENALENIAQISGELSYSDAWKLDSATSADPELRKKVKNLIASWRKAASANDEAKMNKFANDLKKLISR